MRAACMSGRLISQAAPMSLDSQHILDTTHDEVRPLIAHGKFAGYISGAIHHTDFTLDFLKRQKKSLPSCEGRGR